MKMKGLKITPVVVGGGIDECGGGGWELIAVLWIRIRMDPDLLPGSGSGIIVPNLDLAKHERADK